MLMASKRDTRFEWKTAFFEQKNHFSRHSKEIVALDIFGIIEFYKKKLLPKEIRNYTKDTQTHSLFPLAGDTHKKCARKCHFYSMSS